MFRPIRDHFSKLRHERRLAARHGARLDRNDLRGLAETDGPPAFGENSVVSGSLLRGRVTVGAHTVIRECTLTAETGTEIRLGAYTVVNGPGSLLASKHQDVRVGNFCTIGTGAALLSYNHRLDTYTSSFLDKHLRGGTSVNSQSQGPVVLGHDCTIGLNSVVMPGVQLGNGCVVLPNSVVTRSFAAYSIVGGVPATEIGRRFSAAKAAYLEELAYWDWDHDRILRHLPRLLERVSTRERFDG